MAKVFEQKVRLVPTWCEAVRHVANVGEDFNVILEITDPVTMTTEDQAVVDHVDDVLLDCADSSIATVANTIFPWRYANRCPRPGLYDRFVTMMESKGRKKGTWGTYAMRIMRRPGKDGEFYYPLETIITKLVRASAVGHPYKAAYELGVLEPNDDIFPSEIPTYDGALDAKQIAGMPCLSHLSFKMVDRARVNLTAMYRSHYYCSKSLGNLIGLRDLLKFVARESDLEVGTLTCISSFAKFDKEKWGGVVAAKAVLDTVAPLAPSPP